MQNIVAMPLDTACDAASDDATLAAEAQHRPRAFETLYHRYRDRIYWYVRTRTPTEEDAADLTQQIFAQALDALAQYRPQRGSFAAWLFAIARHALTDFHRRHRPTVTWDLVPVVLQPRARHDLEAEFLQREDLDRLRALFQVLPATTREMLVLRFVAGLTVGEIAAVIGKGEAATRKQLARTLHALAADFEGASS